MNITRNLIVAILMTIVTTVLLGVVYPLVVTGLAQVIFPDKANGQLIEQNGKIIGSRIIGQAFSSPGYFRSRPSAAGTGYDAANSAGTNLGPTNKKLIDAVTAAVEAARKENPDAPVPIDLSRRRRPGSTRTSRRRRRSSRCRASRASAASPKRTCVVSSRRTRPDASSASSASRASTSSSSISRSIGAAIAR